MTRRKFATSVDSPREEKYENSSFADPRAFFRQDVTSAPRRIIHSDAFLASRPLSCFRPDAVRRRRGRGRQAHVQVLRDPTDEQEKRQRYRRGDRGGRADTYGRRHFSWSRAVPRRSLELRILLANLRSV